MSFKITDSTQFYVKNITIVSKGGSIEVTSLYEELNIFDSMFLPVMSGNILITDANNLSDKLAFDGSEVIAMAFEKSDGSDIGSFKKSFRIYKQTDRRNLNQNSERYILHFISDEFFFSEQQRITQSYESTYSDIVDKIMKNYLKVEPFNRGLMEKTYGIKKIVVPNLKPLDAIEWCAKRSIDAKNSPNYMFFRNSLGFNFVTLSTLLTKQSILNINFDPKNLSSKNSLQEMSSARAFEILQQDDIIEKTRAGVNAGTFIGFDPITRSFGQKQISFPDVYSAMNHGNENPDTVEIINRDNTSTLTTHDSRKVLSINGAGRKNSSYIKNKDPSSISKVETYENYAFQRKALLKNLISKKVKLVMPGNFQLTSGLNVDLTIPGFGAKTKGDDNDDSSISGKYIIVATRHIITNNKHETLIEIATDSSKTKPSISSPKQNEVLKNYGSR
jgi:hypothetical protein